MNAGVAAAIGVATMRLQCWTSACILIPGDPTQPPEPVFGRFGEMQRRSDGSLQIGVRLPIGRH